MNRRLKYWLKRLSPIPLSKNHRYDRLTSRILKKYCLPGSNCIDIGAHEGYILKLFLRLSPAGLHWAFEPLPYLYDQLLVEFASHPNCTISNYALSNQEGSARFNHVISNPAYSGLKKRRYDRPAEQDETILVETKQLDSVIPAGIRIHIIKIDVEGGEMNVLKGAGRIIAAYHPVIIFEFGTAATETYGVGPEEMFGFMQKAGYGIFLLEDFLNNKPALPGKEFTLQIKEGRNYYFVAAAVGS